MGYAPARREISATRDQVATIPLVPVEINGVELGVELREVLDGALVVGVADEAAAAGLRVGDVVTAVGDTNVAGMNPESVHELGFRVPPGNEVSWTVKRRTAELTLHARAPGPKTRPLYRR
jgi:C-terminal processing protease CtpA/Prc